jgi:heme-degrading monooxygenase HmoA
VEKRQRKILIRRLGDDRQSVIGDSMNMAEARGAIVEIVTFRLKEGITADIFDQFDRVIEEQHVGKQSGFVSRESAAGEDGEWLVVVHWRSIEDADASMESFATAPAAVQFMANIDVNTMCMKRYVAR